MKHDGFLSCTYGEKLIKDDNGLKNIPLSDDEMDDYNIFMKQYGFMPDYEFDCYVVRNVGAFMGNVISFDVLNDPYSDDYRYYRKYVDKGYKLITGPSSPDSFLGLGVFCTNYFDVLRVDNKKQNKKSNILYGKF